MAGEHAELTPGAAQLLQTLHANGTPCAWLDDLPADASLRLAEALPTPIEAVLARQTRPWPAPDSCWQALSQLDVERLDGCVVVSGNPLLLQAGLNAGCWISAWRPAGHCAATPWPTGRHWARAIRNTCAPRPRCSSIVWACTRWSIIWEKSRPAWTISACAGARAKSPEPLTLIRQSRPAWINLQVRVENFQRRWGSMPKLIR